MKMIYIDPPYNTGKDGFVYPDNFMIDSAEFEDMSGAKNENGDTLFSINTEANPRFHSAWCSMMYERLLLARNFLREDGVIFISIHDAEYSNLKMICDEIFGYRHSIGTLVWKARVKPVNIGEAKYRPQKEIEYILVYEKSGVGNKFFPLITGSVRSYPYSLDGRRYRLATILKSNRGANGKQVKVKLRDYMQKATSSLKKEYRLGDILKMKRVLNTIHFIALWKMNGHQHRRLANKS